MSRMTPRNLERDVSKLIKISLKRDRRLPPVRLLMLAKSFRGVDAPVALAVGYWLVCVGNVVVSGRSPDVLECWEPYIVPFL